MKNVESWVAPSTRSLNSRHLCPHARFEQAEARAAIIAGVPLDPWLVPVRAISAGGLSLVAGVPAAPGTAMSVRLFNIERRYECRVNAGVASCQRLPHGDFAVGLTFNTVLSERDARGLGLDSQ